MRIRPIMDSNQRTAGALLGNFHRVIPRKFQVIEYPERATRDISALLQRFENIIEYKPVSWTIRNFRSPTCFASFHEELLLLVANQY